MIPSLEDPSVILAQTAIEAQHFRSSFSTPTQHVSPRFLQIRESRRSINKDDGLLATKVRRLIRSSGFTILTFFLIFAQFGLSIAMIDRRISAISTVTIVLSMVICAIFVVEIGLRIFGFQHQYLRSFWFILDVCTVVAGVVNVSTRTVLLARKETLNNGCAVIILFSGAIMNLRLLRVIRFFQSLRQSQRFHSLWVVSRALFGAMKALSWTSVFLFGIILFYAMIGTELIGNNDFLREHSEDVSTLVEEKFSSVSISMLSCFQIISLDSWSSQLASPIMMAQSKDHTTAGRFRLALMIFYFISLVSLGALVIINMLNAIIVDRSIRYGQSDVESKFVSEQGKLRVAAHNMQLAFVAANSNHDNSLTLEELIATCEDPTSVARPLLLQFGTRDEIVRLFALLDLDGDGKLTIEEFCDGMLRCREDFQKFMLWQLLERQGRDRASVAHMKEALTQLSSKHIARKAKRQKRRSNKRCASPIRNSSDATTAAGPDKIVSELLSSASYLGPIESVQPLWMDRIIARR